jgi:hypothetical protein
MPESLRGDRYIFSLALGQHIIRGAHEVSYRAEYSTWRPTRPKPAVILPPHSKSVEKREQFGRFSESEERISEFPRIGSIMRVQLDRLI